MAIISDKPKTPAEKANHARPPSDGPHKMGKKQKKAEAATGDNPAYVVDVSEKGDTKKANTYSPEAMRGKARSLLQSGKLTPEETSVLKEILGPDKEES